MRSVSFELLRHMLPCARSVFGICTSLRPRPLCLPHRLHRLSQRGASIARSLRGLCMMLAGNVLGSSVIFIMSPPSRREELEEAEVRDLRCDPGGPGAIIRDFVVENTCVWEMGFTDGCTGCRPIGLGRRSQEHSQVGRRRLDTTLTGTDVCGRRLERRDTRNAGIWVTLSGKALVDKPEPKGGCPGQA